jgi:hypothetical protein
VFLTEDPGSREHHEVSDHRVEGEIGVQPAYAVSRISTGEPQPPGRRILMDNLVILLRRSSRQLQSDRKNRQTAEEDAKTMYNFES